MRHGSLKAIRIRLSSLAASAEFSYTHPRHEKVTSQLFLRYKAVQPVERDSDCDGSYKQAKKASGTASNP